MTNYERIMNLTVEELAGLFDRLADGCERFCAFAENGECIGNAEGAECDEGIRRWLENEG